jgi:putative endonuclease
MSAEFWVTRRRKSPAEDRRGAAFNPHELGLYGEALAARYLEEKGFSCEARRLLTKTVEIDLLMRRGRLWVAVEVKTRRRHPAPERTVNPDLVRRLRRALILLAPHLRPRPRKLRIDIVAVNLPGGQSAKLRHWPGQEFLPTKAR